MTKSDIKTKKFDPNNTFFTSDTHFNHKLMTCLFKRKFKSIEEMNNQIIKNWNNKVSPNATIFVLGDFCFGSRAIWSNILDQLNGRIIFIPGNHDYQNESGLKEIFNRDIKVREKMEIKIENYRFHLSHYPCLEWAGEKKGVINLHGHVHGNFNNKKKLLYKTMKFLMKLNVGKCLQFDVGLDNNSNFEPFSYYEIKQALNLR